MVVLIGVAVLGGNEERPLSASVSDDPGPIHVHGLGINPRDGALFIATHTGLWRSGPGETQAERVTDRMQDTMGFTVLGPDRFVGSGHPDPREGLPPLLGLIESTDAGRTWDPVSLLGEADFHLLRSIDARLYGYDATNGRLLFSRDRGRTWAQRAAPEPLLDLSADPSNPLRLIASGERGLWRSTNEGRSWAWIGEGTGLLAWPVPRRLYLLDLGGRLRVSGGGRRWSVVGDVGAEPAAFMAESADELYAALHDGTIMRSANGGEQWTVRSTP